MSVHLTSFKRYMETPGEWAPYSSGMQMYKVFSAAVYQPGWYPEFEKLELFDIRGADGAWIRPRDFMVPGEGTGENPALLKAYHDTLVAVYTQRQELLAEFMEVVENFDEVVLLCWCPYDKAAKRQLEDYGTFVCHTWPIETFLRGYGLDVQRDDDRQRMVTLNGS